MQPQFVSVPLPFIPPLTGHRAHGARRKHVQGSTRVPPCPTPLPTGPPPICHMGAQVHAGTTNLLQRPRQTCNATTPMHACTNLAMAWRGARHPSRASGWAGSVSLARATHSLGAAQSADHTHSWVSLQSWGMETSITSLLVPRSDLAYPRKKKGSMVNARRNEETTMWMFKVTSRVSRYTSQVKSSELWGDAMYRDCIASVSESKSETRSSSPFSLAPCRESI